MKNRGDLFEQFKCKKLKKVFSEGIDNGHNDFNDPNTIILRLELIDAVLLYHGVRYEL